MTGTTTDIAKRVYDHTWKLDPIVRSLLDTDFYKLLMLQMIWKMHRDVQVRFSLINRKQSVRLADEMLGREGRMVRAVEAIGRGEDAFSGTPFVLPLEL